MERPWLLRPSDKLPDNIDDDIRLKFHGIEAQGSSWPMAKCLIFDPLEKLLAKNSVTAGSLATAVAITPKTRATGASRKTRRTSAATRAVTAASDCGSFGRVGEMRTTALATSLVVLAAPARIFPMAMCCPSRIF